MSIVTKSTTYAPDIFKALHGIVLVCKPATIRTSLLVDEIKDRLSDSLNQYEPRPLSKRLQIVGDVGEQKRLVEVPNLADHPLVAGPRYMPWEVKILPAMPTLTPRMSGLEVLALGNAAKYFRSKLVRGDMVSVFHITGKFGHITDNLFDDGKILDKTTFTHIRAGKIDSALARVETSQHHRLFDAAAVPLNSQAAYELAKNWPSRPPRMAKWPVVYRIRCIHLELPLFKLEVTCVNASETFLAEIVNDLGQVLKSGAHTRTIRRVKLGPFDLNQSLTDKDWNLESIVGHLQETSSAYDQLHRSLSEHGRSLVVRSEFVPEYLEERRQDNKSDRGDLRRRLGQANGKFAIKNR